MKPTILFATLASAALVLSSSAQQEFTIQKTVNEIGNTKPIPLSMSGFSGEAASVLRFDLEIQGFKIVDGEQPQYQLSGGNNGNVQGRLFDAINKSQLIAKAYTGGSTRAQAHALADDVVMTILKVKGLGQTKVAFKVDTGSASEVFIADFDGHNAQAVTQDKSIVAAPAWVPGKLALYYTSYKLGSPFIFRHDLSSGQRSLPARFSGLNTSAAISPDGRRMAMILSKSGSPDVYVADADGTSLKQLTATREDESSPCWTADGQSIVFAGKLSGRRALCKVPASGGPVQRIVTGGVSNPSEPDCSPDGKWIVFTAQMGGFELCVIPAAGGTATLLASGEDPSFAPNSRTVIFAKRSGNGRTLSLLDVFTKQSKDVRKISGSNSQPSWAR